MEQTISISKLDGSINTFSGGKINLIDPKIEDINVHDIAKGLSNNPHFAGQTKEFFSIAQHSILVCDIMELEFPAESHPKLLLVALLHDASEAYLGDVVKPLKVFLPEFQIIEDRMQQKIFEKFHLPYTWIKSYIKQYDIQAQQMEYNSFYTDIESLYCMNPEESYHTFLNKYEKYTSYLRPIELK